MSLKTPKLFARRIDPEERVSGHRFPDPESGIYQPLESRARSQFLVEDSKLQRSVYVDLQKKFWDVGIQVITQVSSINLDSEKPEYPGEGWHAQGQMVRIPTDGYLLVRVKL